MNAVEVTVEQVLNLALNLKPSEQAKLISRLAAQMEDSLERPAKPVNHPQRSLRGLLADLGPAPSAEEIDEVRREMWGSFPREDF